MLFIRHIFIQYGEELATLQKELQATQEMVAQLQSNKGLKAIVKQAHKQDVARLEDKYQQWE